MASTTKRRFTDEFKRESVSLWETSGRPQAEIAGELSIVPTMLRRWQRKQRKQQQNRTLLTSPAAKPPVSTMVSPADQASAPPRSAGTDAIIAEAMRVDPLPLFVTVGGGLTEVASALILEPRIAERMTLIWIGGAPYSTGKITEYNYKIDPIAARYIFNETKVPIWQVPRDVYGLCEVSLAELEDQVAPQGAIGAWLFDRLVEVSEKVPFNSGETWTLGDSPLVVLTALTTLYPSKTEPLNYDLTGSSLFEERPAPFITQDDQYEPRPSGRQIRVYRTIDTRLMFADFFAKLRANARG